MNEMKIRINNQGHSKQVQEALFWLGYHWFGSHNTILYTESASLYTDSSGFITHSSLDKVDINNFYEDPVQEYTLENGEFVAVFKGNV